MDNIKKIRILHIVKWFYAGGAERLLSSILAHSDKNKYEHIILSLSDCGERLREIENNLKIPYTSIDIARGKSNFINYLKCFFFVRRINPDIIKTWLPPSNKAGGIIGKILGIPVIWGIHSSKPPNASDKRQFFLSKFLHNQVICCSKPVYDVCYSLGYNIKLLNIILNGTDTDTFIPKLEGRKAIRDEFGISDKSLVIGMAANFVKIKRHTYFLEAAKNLLLQFPNTYFLLCGKDVENNNPVLKNHIVSLGIEKNVYLLGIRNDMPDIYSAMDIKTLCSSSESFGLAITEAMSCKTLCVASNVGIMKELLKDVGEIINVSDNPDQLVSAWEKSISLPDEEKSKRLEKGRRRIIQNYSVRDTAKKYDQFYTNIYNLSKNK